MFQSTHPLRGATLLDVPFFSGISFNPRTPCEVRRRGWKCCHSKVWFQSTHPLRGATRVQIQKQRLIMFQSTHPLRGATRERKGMITFCLFQSTHPLRGATWNFQTKQTTTGFNPRTPCEVRLKWSRLKNSVHMFQSTHPLRGATFVIPPKDYQFSVSIHAPLARCDEWIWKH